MVKKRILIAPLNWGLGHATRCIPLIRELERKGFDPVIASDGEALELLKKEFPLLEHHILPSYNISYSRKKQFFKLHLLLKAPHILKIISAEKKQVEVLVKTRHISGIISDNRWGVHSGLVPSVFITHQLKVLSGVFTFISSKIQQKYIQQFNECWVPDAAEDPNLSGKMGHLQNPTFPVKYIGILSRFKKEFLPITFDIAVILSGPEPQRSILQQILERELKKSPLRILLVKGIVEKEQKQEKKENWTICNFLTSAQLQDYLNQSELIICRPGYTSLMDLAILGKKAFLIPTPGQNEQEYLAKRLKEKGIAGGCLQKEFTLKKLENVKDYKGLGGFFLHPEFSGKFTLFKSE